MGDFLITVNKEAIETFLGKMRERFEVGKAIMKYKIKFNEYLLNVNYNGGEILRMSEYM